MNDHWTDNGLRPAYTKYLASAAAHNRIPMSLADFKAQFYSQRQEQIAPIDPTSPPKRQAAPGTGRTRRGSKGGHRHKDREVLHDLWFDHVHAAEARGDTPPTWREFYTNMLAARAAAESKENP
jgi:hypothetical protein